MKINQTLNWTEMLPSGEELVTAPAFELLSALVTRQPKGRMPPLPVLQDILRRGVLGGGMGGGFRWDAGSIELDGSGYDELVAMLPNVEFEQSCPAKRVEEWRAWCAQKDSGLDYVKHLALLDRLHASDVARSDERAVESEATYARALQDYLDFITSQRSGS